MPIILLPEDEEKWLNPQASSEEPQSILKPYPEEEMSMYEISTLVNSPKNDFKEIAQPI